MSEYKENTVGWWLSQLKEPLKSRALDIGARITTDGLNEAAESMPVALTLLSVCMYRIFGDKDHFWTGVFSFFNPIVYRNTQGMALTSPEWSGGMYMAEKCAPDNWLKPNDGGEDKAIVDSPAPEVLGKKIPLGGFDGFNKWVEAHGHPRLSSEDLLNLNEYPKILYDETFLYPGESPKPKDSWEVERAVVGYEEPKPIDTIEKKHELRIQALEARVMQLEDVVGKLSSRLNTFTETYQMTSMEQDEITRRNVAIAEYMGWEYLRTHTDGLMHWILPGNRIGTGVEACFASDWSVLMPAVEKIINESLLGFHVFPPLDHETFACRFGMGKNYMGNTMIEATWLAVSEYVLALK